MSYFNLGEEILGWNRTDDDESPLVSPTPDARLPWENPLFKYQSATGQVNSLAKNAEISEFCKAVLGDGDDIEALPKLAAPSPKPNVWNSFDQRVEETAETTMQNLLTKATRVATGTPVRKRAIAERIIAPFKKALIDKGFLAGVEQFGDGWERLQNSIEQSVTQAVMAS